MLPLVLLLGGLKKKKAIHRHEAEKKIISKQTNKSPITVTCTKHDTSKGLLEWVGQAE